MSAYLFYLSICCAVILLFAVLRLKRKQKNLLSFYSRMHRDPKFDNMILSIIEELKSAGVYAELFLRRNRKSYTLESNGFIMPVTAHSAAMLAFFTGIPQKCAPDYTDDYPLVDRYGRNIGFVPLLADHAIDCWQLHDCRDQECRCYGKHKVSCWNNSETRCRGRILSPVDKTKTCLGCEAFRPLGIFVVKGNGLSKANEFLKEYVSPVMKVFISYERSSYAAAVDALTRLYNKKSFSLCLSSLCKISQRNNHELSLCMFDIDHFKQFNDAYGHYDGDLLLTELAEVVKHCVRDADIVCRYGGEEFAIIFVDTAKATAAVIAEKLREAVQKHMFLGNREITISLGIASFLEDCPAADSATFVRLADSALYKAKEKRNIAVAYAEKLEVSLLRKGKAVSNNKKLMKKKKSLAADEIASEADEIAVIK